MVTPCKGDVWRNTAIVPFGDHVVLAVDGDNVVLARPHARASEYSRYPWLTAEQYELPIKHLDNERWLLVGQGKVD